MLVIAAAALLILAVIRFGIGVIVMIPIVVMGSVNIIVLLFLVLMHAQQNLFPHLSHANLNHGHVSIQLLKSMFYRIARALNLFHAQLELLAWNLTMMYNVLIAQHLTKFQLKHVEIVIRARILEHAKAIMNGVLGVLALIKAVLLDQKLALEMII